MIQSLDNVGITNFVIMEAMRKATINGERIFDTVERFGDDTVIAVKRGTRNTRMSIQITDLMKGL
jgi:hypothetical protein